MAMGEPPADDPRFMDDDHDAPPPPRNVRALPTAKRTLPTADDPLAGLRILPGIVMRGRDAIIAEAMKPIDYVWHEIVVAGTVNLIAGPPAEGKTTLLFLLLACRMQDTVVPFLGRNLIPAPPGKFVVLIEAEHSDGGTARKLMQSLDTLGFSYDGLNRVLVIARKAVMIGDAAWHAIGLMVAQGLVSDIALDTLARVSGGADANNEAEQASLFGGIAQLIERAPDAIDRPTVWMVAHSKKNDRNGGLGDVSGSAQRTGQSDTVMIVEGKKAESGQTTSSKVTFPKLREPPDNYPQPLTFSVLMDAQGKRFLSSDAVTPGVAAQAAKPLEELIWDQLTEPRTKSWLKEKLGRSAEDIKKAVDNLFAAGHVGGADVSYPGTKKTYRGIQRRAEKGTGPRPGPGVQQDFTRTAWDGIADNED